MVDNCRQHIDKSVLYTNQQIPQICFTQTFQELHVVLKRVLNIGLTTFRIRVSNVVKTLIVVLVFVKQRKFKFVQAYAQSPVIHHKMHI